MKPSKFFGLITMFGLMNLSCQSNTHDSKEQSIVDNLNKLDSLLNYFEEVNDTINRPVIELDELNLNNYIEKYSISDPQ